MHDTPPEPGRKTALLITLAVHSLLVLALFFGLQWRAKHAPVEVELWAAPAPAAQAAPKPAPMPEIKPAPEPEIKPEPPKEVPKPIPKPDIAVKPEKKDPPPKPPPKPAPTPKLPDFSKALEDELREIRQNRQEGERLAQAEAAGRELAEKSWIGKITAKVRSNVVQLPNIAGRPKAVFTVHILPSGEINSQNPPRLIQSSGNATLDEILLRAILKSSPFPLPDSPAVFQRELKLVLDPYGPISE